VVVESQACLIGNRRGLLADPERLEATRGLLELIEAHLRSRHQISLTANMRGESAEGVARRVLATGDAAGLRGPTVAPVYAKDPDPRGGAWFALTVVVNESGLLAAVEALRRAGAADVTATPVRYVFERDSWTFEALKRQLQPSKVGDQARTKRTAWSSS
jgi:ATP phosphoribosyltransferase